MIHIKGEAINICNTGYIEMITAYCRYIREDYEEAVIAKNLRLMTELEKHVLSDKFWGEAIGLSSSVMIRYLRDSYDHDKYIIIRDKNTLLPIEVTERTTDGES